VGLKLKIVKLCTQHCCWRDRERERERERERVTRITYTRTRGVERKQREEV